MQNVVWLFGIPIMSYTLHSYIVFHRKIKMWN